MSTDSTLRVFIEAGTRRVFASALDWPGWARSAKNEELAVAALTDYLPRYLPIVAMAGCPAPDGILSIAERHEGLAKNADFGALGEVAPSDGEPVTAGEAARLVALLTAAWTAGRYCRRRAPAATQGSARRRA
jgi:hypothetical protein